MCVKDTIPARRWIQKNAGNPREAELVHELAA
jgi:hypothetical protein